MDAMKSSGRLSFRSSRLYSEKIGRTIKTTTHRRTYHVLTCVDQDPYPEEYGMSNKRNRGYRGYWKSKPIWPHQIRMYRTWKHTRKTQWKPK